MSKLTTKQAEFVKEYLIDLNATQAALRAGYSKKTAYSQGQRLLKNAETQEAIQKAMDERSKRTEITQDMVLQELGKIGFANMLDYVTPNEFGDVSIDLSALTRDQAAAIGEITVDEYMEGSRDDVRNVKRVKFKLLDKKGALVDLGRHLGMFPQNLKVSGKVKHDHTHTHEELSESATWLEDIIGDGQTEPVKEPTTH